MVDLTIFFFKISANRKIQRYIAKNFRKIQNSLTAFFSHSTHSCQVHFLLRRSPFFEKWRFSVGTVSALIYIFRLLWILAKIWLSTTNDFEVGWSHWLVGLVSHCRKKFAYWQSLAPYSAKFSEKQNFTSIFANFTLLAKFNFCEKMQFVENGDFWFWLFLRWMWNIAEYGFWRKHNSVCFGHFRKNPFSSVFANLTHFRQIYLYWKNAICGKWRISAWTVCVLDVDHGLILCLAKNGFCWFHHFSGKFWWTGKVDFRINFWGFDAFCQIHLLWKNAICVFRSALFLCWWTFSVVCEFWQKLGCWPQIILRLVGLAGWLVWLVSFGWLVWLVIFCKNSA